VAALFSEDELALASKAFAEGHTQSSGRIESELVSKALSLAGLEEVTKRTYFCSTSSQYLAL